MLLSLSCPFVHPQRQRQPCLNAIQPQFEDDAVVTQPCSAEFKLEAVPAQVMLFATSPKQKRRARRRQVRFADASSNKAYDNQVMNATECRALWYSTADLMAFRRDYRDLLLTLHHLDVQAAQNPSAWAGSLRCAYQAFCTTDNTTTLLQALSQTIPNATFLLSALGTERAALRSVVTDAMLRRKEMYRVVQLLTDTTTQQQQPLDDTDLIVAKACRTLSRPSRLYARHVAEMAAGKSVFKAEMI